MKRVRKTGYYNLFPRASLSPRNEVVVSKYSHRLPKAHYKFENNKNLWLKKVSFPQFVTEDARDKQKTEV